MKKTIFFLGLISVTTIAFSQDKVINDPMPKEASPISWNSHRRCIDLISVNQTEAVARWRIKAEYRDRSLQ
jgi:hypothetical protein